MPLYSKDISVMLDAVQDAFKFVMRDFYEISRLQCSQNIDGMKKFSDQAYNKAKSTLVYLLQESRPEFGFSKDDGQEYYWQVTPIDGLSNFLRSMPHFAICVSLYRGDEMLAIVIGLPVFQQLFWSEKGYGAYLEENSNTIKLRINNNIKAQKSAVIALSGINGKLFQALQGMQYRITGSTYVNMAYVAAGKFDALICMQDKLDKSLLIKEAYGNTLSVSNYNIIGQRPIASVLVDNLKNGPKN